MTELTHILRDCRPYLALIASDRRPLLRGVDPSAPPFFSRDVPRDRRPRNMPTDLHDVADAWFSATFGIRYRGAAVFCTGRREQAASFGNAYLMFPVGGFRFCWSPFVDDLHAWAVREDHLSKPPPEFVQLLGRLDYREDDLAAAVASGNEVMLACTRYHAVRANTTAEEAAVLHSLLGGRERP